MSYTDRDAREEQRQLGVVRPWLTALTTNPTYWGLLLLRLGCVALPGYIHPDEFFQGSEPMARDILGLNATIPWEYAEDPPCRSIATAGLTAGVPFYALRLLEGALGRSLGGWAVLMAPRLWMFLLSLITDATILNICSDRLWDRPNDSVDDPTGFCAMGTPVLMAMGLMWTGAVMQARPLSNSVELVCVSIMLLVGFTLGEIIPRGGGGSPDRDAYFELYRWCYFGVAAAVALYVRFTSLIWTGCIALQMIALFTNKRNRMMMGWQAFGVIVGKGVVFAAVMCGFLTFFDSLYFGTMNFVVDTKAIGYWTLLTTPSAWISATQNGTLTLTPINSFYYNYNTDNLALHGVHPHWTHIAVNLPLLLGPLMLYVCFDMLEGAGQVWVEVKENMAMLKGGQAKKRKKQGKQGAAKQRQKEAAKTSGKEVLRAADAPPQIRERKRQMVTLYYEVHTTATFMGVVVLSIVPHQEARFLLPLMLSFSLMHGASLFGSGLPGYQEAKDNWLWPRAKTLVALSFVLYQLAMIAFFGGLHQAGVARSVIELDATVAAAGVAQGAAATVFYYHTYMPPVALARHKLGDEAPGVPSIIDLTSGCSEGELYTHLLRASFPGAYRTQPRKFPNDDSGDMPWDMYSKEFAAPQSAKVSVSATSFLVFAPGSVAISENLASKHGGKLGSLARVTSWWPHVSTEDPLAAGVTGMWGVPWAMAALGELGTEKASLMAYKYTPPAAPVSLPHVIRPVRTARQIELEARAESEKRWKAEDTAKEKARRKASGADDEDDDGLDEFGMPKKAKAKRAKKKKAAKVDVVLPGDDESDSWENDPALGGADEGEGDDVSAEELVAVNAAEDGAKQEKDEV